MIELNSAARKSVVSTPPDPNEPNLLGKVTSLVVLLGAGLYFTGWTYRWAYFSFFNLEVSTLNFPFDSFYLAAFHALFGSPFAIIRTAIALILTATAIHLTLWLIKHPVMASLTTLTKRVRSPLLNYARQHPNAWLSQGIQSLVNFSSTQFNSLQFLGSLTIEIVIVLWALTALFWLAQWQADTDAWLDAVNETSTLPIITVVAPDNTVSLGRQLDNPLVNPSGFRIIGDQDLYQRLLGKELTDTSNPETPIVWRLLTDRDGYFYIFPALPDKRDRTLSPPVVMMYESDGGDQLMILSPPTSRN
ncbi:MAG: hypothetical protein RIE73_05600 [Coleofasciculus sp. C1-SOL-03]|uniref:hypothetical protein n=1 Tax=Coleofasciculus sp. C1-SOL-03 TaxID=3069522 RepID=UPI0032FE23D5